MNRHDTMNTSFELYDLLREPVIVLRDGAEVYSNPAAKTVGNIPEEVREYTPPFESAVTWGDVTYSLSAKAVGDYTVIFLYKDSTDNREFMSALGIQLNERLMGLTVAVRRFEYDIIDPQTEKYLSMMRHSIASIRRTAGNLQFLGEPSPYAETRSMDLDETVYDLVGSVNALAMGQTAAVEFKSDETQKIFSGSNELLERAILNLLSNSMKSTPKDGKIVVKCEKKGAKAVITVADNGSGIPDEMMNVLFRSYNAERGLTDMNRLGMGLAVTQKIAQKLGGTLLAYNRKPKGAEFVLTLPITDSYPNKFSSPDTEYSKTMTMLHTELSGVLDYRSYETKFSD